MLTTISSFPPELKKWMDNRYHNWLQDILNMDKSYKKLGKEAAKIEKDTKKVLAKDEKRDVFVKAGKKAMSKKGKC